MDFSGSSLPELFPHAALIGSTVDYMYDVSSRVFLFALGTRTLFLRLLVSGSFLFDVVLEYKIWNFLGDPFRKRSRIHRIWFDSGCMFASAHEVMGDKGVNMPVVMQDSLVKTVNKPVEAPQVQFLARLWWVCLSLCNDRSRR